jgi:hypothetical protein
MAFKEIKKQVLDQFDAMVASGATLFITDAIKDFMWDQYLEGFTDETRQHHNCNCCRVFIKNYGAIVTIVDNKLVTVWDFVAQDPEYDASIKMLQAIVSMSNIRDKFVNDFIKLGTAENYDMDNACTWEHFAVVAPDRIKVKKDKKETIMSEFRALKQVTKRSLMELTEEASDIVLDLIAQGSLYRGSEFEKNLKFFRACQRVFNSLPESQRDNYVWRLCGEAVNPAGLAIKNTAIGTLLVDLSAGKDVDFAVTAFEKVVAPTNYKRPTALITKGMIEEAEKTIAVLGISESLGRRFAVPEDISVDNVLFVNRNAKVAANVFEELKEEVTVSPKSLSKVEEITIDKFIKEVLPTVSGIEVLVENSHLANLVSVIAPINAEAPNLMKWSNPYSWSYVNALTDSVIKERVKAAGGNVNGVIRVSLSWFNYDDLDLWVKEPNGNWIGFNTFKKPRIAPTTGQLDVDMNAGNGDTRQGVENITWTDESKMLSGNYEVHVDQFAMREVKDIGCIVEIEFNGETFTFELDQKMVSNTHICSFHFDKTKRMLTFVGSDPGSGSVKSVEKWGVNTNRFQKVSMIMNSPNYWKDTVGNKHTFFVIEGAKNDETPRGFFNEFLNDELTKNRRVFEVLGSRLKVEPSDRQLTGVGFSSTQRNSIICRVEGNFKRTLKVNF